MPVATSQLKCLKGRLGCELRSCKPAMSNFRLLRTSDSKCTVDTTIGKTDEIYQLDVC